MVRTTQAAVMHGVRDVRLEEREVSEVGPLDVLVRIARVGVCASDVHYYTHGRIGKFVVEAPIVLGHESSGVVEAVGAEVMTLSPGDRVALEPGYPCRRCVYCKTGRYNLCPHMTFMATPPVNGAFSQYVVWPEDFTFKVPPELSGDAAALLEPLAVGLWATRRGEVKVGDAVAVFGAGPIGCTTIQAAKAAGATTIVAVDLEPFRLDLARQVGATHTVNGRDGDAVKRVRELTGQPGLPGEYAGPDVAFETAGSLATCRMAISAPRPGGVAVLVGLPPDPLVPLDIVGAASREVDIRGLFRYANCYPAAIELVRTGQVDLDALVTQRFALERVQEALEFADREKASSMKVMVDVS